MNQFLALVCILREDNFEKQGLIDYNFNCFREAIQEVFEVNKHGHSGHDRVVGNHLPGPSSASPSSPPSTSGYGNNNMSGIKDGALSPFGNHVVGSAQSNGYAGGDY